ncbi:DUF3616 domain-containing protein [Roseitranquillus sediminis]|uniref:DUF3616 domain-containing protein n=1 Tax=Roseitranquillus sediminis TaxID=2809051 RepID=UPI0029CA33E9|nr:DUF3616 domain-containing protein [Roseitranquillus sediminis]
MDRLTREANNRNWGNHVHFALGELVDLPAGPGGEMDIEGLDARDGWLWVVGSHSLKRGKAEGNSQAGLEALACIERDPNRAFLARIPLVDTGDGPMPVRRDRDRRLAHIKLRKNKSVLRKWLRKDPHLAPFLDLPCKENGFDIEGIAARDLRGWMGLRGPVLRGLAVVLGFEMKLKGGRRLKARRIEGKRRYRKHLLPVRGQGVRDLALEGDDLILLTGPAMAGDGAAAIWRWRGGALATASGLVAGGDVEMIRELPYRGVEDHPEGIVRWDDSPWMVVYDSPAQARLGSEPARVTADIWAHQT